ncbi:translation elongation factor Ts [Angustibacter aerolatus]|uniref:Elongation factor Ts n=1 Tax=Angustibacter aerolatus TaxID=1162965 RepID=A0ABQ6JBN8_9ACTN|nr:translation elongation factor Ts [Angustibacter aerolatus]GMA85588.1 elongation factor Ts [Angustibacter aerolatus]
MANYTAADIKALRGETGAGMLDVKKALDEADGDRAKATEILRIKGQKGVAKREGRDASNGLVAVHVDGGAGTIVEVNCETDFVAKGDKFQVVAQRVLDQAVAIQAQDADALLDSTLDGKTVREVLDEANASIGEKIEVRRVARVEGAYVASYLHKTSPDLPPQVGVLVATDGETPVAREVAMHVAAFPATKFLSRDEVPAETVETEQRIARETAIEEGKPEAALPRIVEGRVNGFFKESVLVEQAFARDSKKTVGQVLDEAGVKALGFARFRVGA